MMESLSPQPILLPVIALVLWTLFMQVWMVVTRVPAMSKSRLHPQEAERTITLGDKLPKNVQWKADNYNHLMEHPTIFYAAALAIGLAGLGSGLNLIMAWSYVGIRVMHSLVQVTVNKVALRFSLFVLSSIALMVMATNAAIAMI
jgi:hypothetical protein